VCGRPLSGTAVISCRWRQLFSCVIVDRGPCVLPRAPKLPAIVAAARVIAAVGRMSRQPLRPECAVRNPGSGAKQGWSQADRRQDDPGRAGASAGYANPAGSLL